MSTSSQLTGTSSVPPGFRFHPTDEELVGYYLAKKVASSKIDLDVIRDIELYKIEPWDLQERCRIGSAEQHEWYFFSHKDKKYPTGTRTNRATTAGFWKATGRDKPIFARPSKLIGMRKTLVFYKGRAPNGQKSDWIMHEYRLEDDINNTAANEEGWVVCRVFKKRSIVKKPSTDYDGYDEEAADKAVCNSANFVKQELDSGIYFPFAYDHSLPRLESPKRISLASSPLNESTPLIEEDPAALLQHLRAAAAVASLTTTTTYTDNELEELVHKSFGGADHFHAFGEEMVISAWPTCEERVLCDQQAQAQHDQPGEDHCNPKESRLLNTSESNLECLVQRMSKGQQQQLQADYSYDVVDLWGFNR